MLVYSKASCMGPVNISAARAAVGSSGRLNILIDAVVLYGQHWSARSVFDHPLTLTITPFCSGCCCCACWCCVPAAAQQVDLIILEGFPVHLCQIRLTELATCAYTTLGNLLLLLLCYHKVATHLRSLLLAEAVDCNIDDGWQHDTL